MDILAATTNVRLYTNHPTKDKYGNPIKTGMFITLKMMGLQHYYQMFKHEEIDFVALSLMNDRDIASLVDKKDIDQMKLLVGLFQEIQFFQQAMPG